LAAKVERKKPFRDSFISCFRASRSMRIFNRCIFFLLEQKEAKIQERFKMVAAHHGLKAFSMRSALAEQRNSKR
jgi:hypothetical protein